MKKRLVTFTIIAVLAILLFPGCCINNKKDTSLNSKDNKIDNKGEGIDKIVIGVSLPTQREERWLKDKEQMEKEAKKLGVDLIVQISDTDAVLQASQVEHLISKGVDVLILAPHDAIKAAASVEKAHEAGISVISYDRLIMNAEVDLYLSFDNLKIGELQGKYITEKVPKGNYVVMSGASTDNNAKLFKKGAMKYIMPLVCKGDIKIVSEQVIDNWEPQNALKIVENALISNNNDIQAILAPNDSTAAAAITALESEGLAGKVTVIGQDSELTAVQRIVKGTQSMTIFKDTRKLGTAAIECAVKMVKNENIDTSGQSVNNNKIDVPSLLIAPLVVDKENIDKVLIESGYVKKEDVYKNN